MRLLLPTVTVYRILTYKTSSTPPLCVEVSVPGMQLRVSILPFFVYDCVIGFRNYGKVLLYYTGINTPK